MAFTGVSVDHRSLSFSRGELTGAIGDSVTVLPLVVALATLTELSLAPLLLGFAVFQVVWGLYYGLPVSVEPMKALAALAVAGALTVDEFLAAGLLAGAALLVVGRVGALRAVERHVGRPVIRGVQVAVALLLLETGVSLGGQNVPLAGGVLALALLVVALGYRRAAALVVLGVGVVLALATTGRPSLVVPSLSVGLPALSAATTADAAEATVAQLAMTVGNAAVATSLLLDDYFGADVSPDALATSMGVTNLLAVPFGALPMCHGSGGVAGKYAFGARSAGANLLLGLLYALAALFAVDVVLAFPMAAVGVVLALVAVELGRSGLETDHLPTTLAVGVFGLVAGVGVAFVAGAVAYPVFRRVVTGE